MGQEGVKKKNNFTTEVQSLFEVNLTCLLSAYYMLQKLWYSMSSVVKTTF